jgi:hypothetical protein
MDRARMMQTFIMGTSLARGTGESVTANKILYSQSRVTPRIWAHGGGRSPTRLPYRPIVGFRG